MNPHVFITSFQLSHELPAGVSKHAVTVYAPKGYEAYSKIDWTDIRQADGTWTRPRNFVGEPDPLASYWRALFELYDSRRAEAERWRDGLLGDVALCCWCPHDRAAQRQLAEHGSFVCHTGPLGQWIETRLGLRVWYDQARREMKQIRLSTD